MKKYFILVVAMISLLSCTKTNPSDDLAVRAARFEEQIDQSRKDLRNVGLNVVVVKGNEIVYTHSFGYKNLETLELMHDSCLFRIASISKSFTTLSLMQMVEQGRVSLSDDVSELAGFPIHNPRYPEKVITLEMLLSHTSSINDSEGYFTLDVINPETNPDWANCYNEYAPGDGYEYCNLNINLAGSFLEKITGIRFDQAVRKLVLDPLHLYAGYCVDSLDVTRFASLYQEPADAEYPAIDTTELSFAGPTTEPELLMHYYANVDCDAYVARSELISNYHFGHDVTVFSPTGGMKISAVDLARYMMLYMNEGKTAEGVQLISPESVKNMERPRSDDENYGLSLWQTDLYSPGVTLVGHTGSAYGLRSAMFFNPAEHYGFVVISNGALESTPESWADTDPSGEAAGDGNILTRTLRLLYQNFIL